MGWFDDSPEEKKIKETQQKIAQKGLLNLIDENDFQKVAILQRDCMIALLAQNVMANSGMVGDSIAFSTQGSYYKVMADIIKPKE